MGAGRKEKKPRMGQSIRMKKASALKKACAI